MSRTPGTATPVLVVLLVACTASAPAPTDSDIDSDSPAIQHDVGQTWLGERGSLGVALSGWSIDGDRHEAREEAPQAADEALAGLVGAGVRPSVVYAHPGLDEWFASRTRGAELGWTVQGSGDRVVLDVALTGAVQA